MNKTSLEIEGSGGAIYLPYLSLRHTAWSAQKGMSILSPGSTLTAVWSKVLPLTASCLLPLRVCPDSRVV